MGVCKVVPAEATGERPDEVDCDMAVGVAWRVEGDGGVAVKLPGGGGVLIKVAGGSVVMITVAGRV